MVYIGIVAAIFFIDGLIKWYIEKSKRSGEISPKWKGFLWIRKYHNTGAFLNLGENHQGVVKWISVLLCVFMTVVFAFTLGQKGNGMLKAGLALLLGGSYSNTYDRLRRKYVVDYFSLHIENRIFKGLSKVVFNISDFCIAIGAMVAVWRIV